MTFALSGGNIFPNLANAVNTGYWYHLVGVLSGTNGTLYINGIPVATMGGSGTMLTTAQPLYIGSTQGSSNFYNGQIDDVRIYNYALTPIQVKNLYNNNSAVKF